jgi:ribosomal protein L37AE/L43A
MFFKKDGTKEKKPKGKTVHVRPGEKYCCPSCGEDLTNVVNYGIKYCPKCHEPLH